MSGSNSFCNHKITQIFTRNCEDTRSQRTEVREQKLLRFQKIQKFRQFSKSVFCFLFSGFWSCVYLVKSRGSFILDFFNDKNEAKIMYQRI